MNSSRRYEYVMEEAEIRECGLSLLWEGMKGRSGMWLKLVLILTVVGVLTGSFFFALMMFILFLNVCLNYCSDMAKILRGQPAVVWIEGDRLKERRRNYSEIPCRNIQTIRRTRRLLLMGCMPEAKQQVWYMVPLRVFADEQEVQQFLAMLRNPQNQWQGQNPMQGQNQWQGQNHPQTGRVDLDSQPETQAEYLRLFCRLNGERWVHLEKGAYDLLNGGSLGKSQRFRRIILGSCLLFVFLLGGSLLELKKFDFLIVGYCFALVVWLGFCLLYQNPEKKIRQQIKTPQALASVCGLWQLSLTEEGVCVSMPTERKTVFMWESLTWLVETEDAFYLFGSDKKSFIAIPKESFVTREQVELFHQICADHGLLRIAPKKARYVPGWLMLLILLLIPLVCLGIAAAVKVSADRSSVPEYVSYDYRRVPLDEQVEVLEALGLYVPAETVESVRSSMEEHGLQDMVEGSPYTWLLMDMGAPAHDEDWNVTGYSKEVYWFDFEGFDLSTDYIEILNGMLALAEGSCLDEATDMQEDMTDVDWERGKGKIKVSLTWKGQTYSYQMKVFYDWIDTKVLGIFNPLLEQEGSQKYFYATGDDGQGAIVFFCTEDWAKEFMEKTGLVLEKESTKANKVR